jgi:hypothetical protein
MNDDRRRGRKRRKGRGREGNLVHYTLNTGHVRISPRSDDERQLRLPADDN